MSTRYKIAEEVYLLRSEVTGHQIEILIKQTRDSMRNEVKELVG
jgi:hypothetical protein